MFVLLGRSVLDGGIQGVTYLRQLQEVPANPPRQFSQICWLHPAHPSVIAPTKCLQRGDNTWNHIQGGPV